MRRNRRVGRIKKEIKESFIIALCIIIAFSFIVSLVISQDLLSIVIIIAIVILICLLIRIIKKHMNRTAKENEINIIEHKENEINTEKEIYVKDIMTECEKEFYSRLKAIFNNYTIQPQIPLRMIIKDEKNPKGLHKYIDFGIFDENYKLLALIELNDSSHHDPKRKKRDEYVKEICREAKIPLITFWTYGTQTNEQMKYIIEKRIEECKK